MFGIVVTLDSFAFVGGDNMNLHPNAPLASPGSPGIVCLST